MRRFLFICIPLILLFTVGITFVHAQTPDSLIATVMQSEESFVQIKALRPPNIENNGAGVIISPDGFIVTNLHVVVYAERVVVYLSNKTAAPAKIVKLMPDEDLALLKIEPPFPLKPIGLADSDHVRLGDAVINIGNSALLRDTISGGKVWRLGTLPDDAGLPMVEFIVVNMNLYGGDSGGPLLNSDGQLIGMIMAKYHNRDRAAIAIPSNKIKKLYLASLK